jgi:hypothetical protein
MSAEIAIDAQHDLRCRKRGNCEDDHASHHEVQPSQQGHLAERHPRATHREDRGDEVHRRPNAADAGDKQAQCPEVSAVTEREWARGKRGIRKPSDVRGIAGAVESVSAEEAEVEKQTSKYREPKTQSVQPGKSHIPCANHQRNQVCAEAKQDGHRDEEDHGGAVHREQAVENLRRHEMIVWNHQLYPHHRRFDATDHEKDERVDDVHNAELLVVDGDHPGVQPFANGSSGNACGIYRN